MDDSMEVDDGMQVDTDDNISIEDGSDAMEIDDVEVPTQPALAFLQSVAPGDSLSTLELRLASTRATATQPFDGLADHSLSTELPANYRLRVGVATMSGVRLSDWITKAQLTTEFLDTFAPPSAGKADESWVFSFVQTCPAEEIRPGAPTQKHAWRSLLLSTTSELWLCNWPLREQLIESQLRALLTDKEKKRLAPDVTAAAAVNESAAVAVNRAVTEQMNSLRTPEAKEEKLLSLLQEQHSDEDEAEQLQLQHQLLRGAYFRRLITRKEYDAAMSDLSVNCKDTLLLRRRKLAMVKLERLVPPPAAAYMNLFSRADDTTYGCFVRQKWTPDLLTLIVVLASKAGATHVKKQSVLSTPLARDSDRMDGAKAGRKAGSKTGFSKADLNANAFSLTLADADSGLYAEKTSQLIVARSGDQPSFIVSRVDETGDEIKRVAKNVPALVAILGRAMARHSTEAYGQLTPAQFSRIVDAQQDVPSEDRVLRATQKMRHAVHVELNAPAYAADVGTKTRVQVDTGKGTFDDLFKATRRFDRMRPALQRDVERTQPWQYDSPEPELVTALRSAITEAEKTDATKSALDYYKAIFEGTEAPSQLAADSDGLYPANLSKQYDPLENEFEQDAGASVSDELVQWLAGEYVLDEAREIDGYMDVSPGRVRGMHIVLNSRDNAYADGISAGQLKSTAFSDVYVLEWTFPTPSYAHPEWFDHPLAVQEHERLDKALAARYSYHERVAAEATTGQRGSATRPTQTNLPNAGGNLDSARHVALTLRVSDDAPELGATEAPYPSVDDTFLRIPMYTPATTRDATNLPAELPYRAMPLFAASEMRFVIPPKLQGALSINQVVGNQSKEQAAPGSAPKMPTLYTPNRWQELDGKTKPAFWSYLAYVACRLVDPRAGLLYKRRPLFSVYPAPGTYEFWDPRVPGGACIVRRIPQQELAAGAEFTAPLLPVARSASQPLTRIGWHVPVGLDAAHWCAHVAAEQRGVVVLAAATGTSLVFGHSLETRLTSATASDQMYAAALSKVARVRLAHLLPASRLSATSAVSLYLRSASRSAQNVAIGVTGGGGDDDDDDDDRASSMPENAINLLQQLANNLRDVPQTCPIPGFYVSGFSPLQTDADAQLVQSIEDLLNVSAVDLQNNVKAAELALTTADRVRNTYSLHRQVLTVRDAAYYYTTAGAAPEQSGAAVTELYQLDAACLYAIASIVDSWHAENSVSRNAPSLFFTYEGGYVLTSFSQRRLRYLASFFHSEMYTKSAEVQRVTAQYEAAKRTADESQLADLKQTYDKQLAKAYPELRQNLKPSIADLIWAYVTRTDHFSGIYNGSQFEPLSDEYPLAVTVKESRPEYYLQTRDVLWPKLTEAQVQTATATLKAIEASIRSGIDLGNAFSTALEGFDLKQFGSLDLAIREYNATRPRTLRDDAYAADAAAEDEARVKCKRELSAVDEWSYIDALAPTRTRAARVYHPFVDFVYRLAARALRSPTLNQSTKAILTLTRSEIAQGRFARVCGFGEIVKTNRKANDDKEYLEGVLGSIDELHIREEQDWPTAKSSPGLVAGVRAGLLCADVYRALTGEVNQIKPHDMNTVEGVRGALEDFQRSVWEPLEEDYRDEKIVIDEVSPDDRFVNEAFSTFQAVAVTLNGRDLTMSQLFANYPVLGQKWKGIQPSQVVSLFSFPADATLEFPYGLGNESPRAYDFFSACFVLCEEAGDRPNNVVLVDHRDMIYSLIEGYLQP